MQQSLVETLGLVNHEAETSILAAMLQSEDLALALLKQVEENNFFDPRRKVVFTAIHRLIMGIEPMNRENILAECKAVAVELDKKNPAKITNEFLDSLRGNVQDAVRSASLVHRLAWLRGAADYAHWLVNSLQMNPDPNELYADAQSRWQILAPEKKDGATLYGWDTVKYGKDLAILRKEEAATGKNRRFDWPWDTWNKFVRPGIAGWVGVLAAPDGVGKSTYLEWIAEHWAKKGNKTVLVHLEDNHEYKINRRKARLSRVPLDVIEDGTTTPEQDWAIEEGERSISEWVANLHYTHLPDASMADVLAELQKLVDEGQCECVVLDYIDKCEADRRQMQLYGKDGQYAREGDNMNRFKNFCEKNKIPGFTATQGNKSMQEQGKIQTRQAIDGSGKKSQRAQLVIILTRDIVGATGLWDGNQLIAKEGDYSPIATLRIDKQNRGITTTFHQIFRGECYRIGDPPEGFKVGGIKEFN